MQAGIGSVFAFNQASDVLALGAAVFAFLCLILNWVLLLRHAEVQRERLRSERDSGMLQWSQESIAAFAEGERLCADKDDVFKPEEFRRRQSETVSQLSVLLDRGQLFFPNVDTDRYASRRASSQGPRQDAMEALFQAYLTLKNVDATDKGTGVNAAAQRLFEYRKLFVEEVFGSVSPKRRQAALGGPNLRKADKGRPARRPDARQAPAAAA